MWEWGLCGAAWGRQGQTALYAAPGGGIPTFSHSPCGATSAADTSALRLSASALGPASHGVPGPRKGRGVLRIQQLICPGAARPTLSLLRHHPESAGCGPHAHSRWKAVCSQAFSSEKRAGSSEGSGRLDLLLVTTPSV